MKVKNWSAAITISEHDGVTYAEARLHTLDTDQLIGTGRAKLNPSDLDVPEIGDEVAVARALTDLGRRLLRAATEDIQAISHEPAHLHA